MAMIVIFCAAYLLGAIPSGLLVGRYLCHGMDIRTQGSGNIGATNAFRVLGAGPGLVVLVADVAKGMLAVYLALNYLAAPLAVVLCGAAAIAGHTWPVFLRFRGGRGVAVGLGVIAMLVPKVTVVVFVVWLLIVLTTRYVSLASIVGAALTPLLMLLWRAPAAYLYFVALAAAFVIYRHVPNIKRLWRGEELKLQWGAKGRAKKDKRG